jgi:hypothetical protein
MVVVTGVVCDCGGGRLEVSVEWWMSDGRDFSGCRSVLCVCIGVRVGEENLFYYREGNRRTVL